MAQLGDPSAHVCVVAFTGFKSIPSKGINGLLVSRCCIEDDSNNAMAFECALALPPTISSSHCRSRRVLIMAMRVGDAVCLDLTGVSCGGANGFEGCPDYTSDPW